MARELDFDDGFESSSEPTQGALESNSLQTHADDASFVIQNGAAVNGSTYLNTASNRIRTFKAGFWVNDVDQTDLVVFETGVQTLTDKDLSDVSNTFPSDILTETSVDVVTNKDMTSGTNTFPTTLATLTGAQTLTNKIIDGTNNTLTILETDIDSDIASDGDVLTADGVGGSAFLIPGASGLDSHVYLQVGNGSGSTNTKIRRFAVTPISSSGTDITVVDSATLGMTFTVNVTGIYTIDYGDQGTANTRHGISLNTSQPTVDIFTITAADRLAMVQSNTTDGIHCSCTIRLTATDIIRAHHDGNADNTNTLNWFRIVRIG